jgi:O-antigen/teichoic acid export membrane protein
MISNIGQLRKSISELSIDCSKAYPLYLAIRFLVSLAISILLVKAGFDLSMISEYEWMMFVVMLTSIFWSSGISSALVSFSKKGEKGSTTAGFWLTTIAGLIVGFAIFLIGRYSTIISYAHQEYLLLAIFVIISGGSLPLIETSFLIQNDAPKLTKYGIWSQLLLLCSVAAVSFFTKDIFWVMLAIIANNVIRWLYLVFFVLSDDLFAVKKTSMISLLRYASPICLTLILGSMMDGLDGVLVQYFYSADQFAIYRFGGKELPFVNLIFVGLSTAMIPQLMSDKTLDITALRSKATRLMHWFMPIAIVLMISSPFIFTYVYSTSFIPSAYIFNTYLLIMVSRVLLPQTVLQAVHANDVILWSTVIELIANLVLSLVFVHYLGMVGLALGTAVAYLIQKMIMLAVLKQKRSITIHQLIDTKWYVGYSIILVAAYLFVGLMEN